MAAIGADEKKKLMILGGLILLILVVVLVLYNPFSGGETPVVPQTTTAKAPGADAPAPAAGGAPVTPGAGSPGGAPGGAPAAALTSVPAGSGTTARFINAAPWRPDPFAPPGVLIAAPTPIPPPAPTPVPLIEVPRPQVIVAPAAIPAPFIRAGVGPTLSEATVLTVIPPARIPLAPRVPTTPSGPPNGRISGGPVGIARSSNKRLSGIIIGDGVRALLEMDGPDGKVTRVVQPGDEVDGIQVLRIERNTEGGRVNTRMIIREGAEDRYVELRASPQARGAAGAGDAAGGTTPRGRPGGGFGPAPP